MPWACAMTYVMQENKAVENLERQGFTAFCPVHQVPNPRKLTELKREVLFPGYVFVMLLPTQPWGSINSTHGVIRLMTDQMRRNVRWRDKDADPHPLYVADDIVEPLFEVRSEGLEPHATVRIRNRNNSFYDMVGKIDSMSGTERVCVLMSMFNRDMVVEFLASELEIVGD